MLDSIIAYVNYYCPQNKRKDYDDNFIKTCLVYKFLCLNYLGKNVNIDDIIDVGIVSYQKLINTLSTIIKSIVFF